MVVNVRLSVLAEYNLLMIHLQAPSMSQNWIVFTVALYGAHTHLYVFV